MGTLLLAFLLNCTAADSMGCHQLVDESRNAVHIVMCVDKKLTPGVSPTLSIIVPTIPNSPIFFLDVANCYNV